MKSILSKILICSLILSFGLGVGGFKQGSAAGQQTPAATTQPATTLVVTAQPLSSPSVVLTQPAATCSGVGSASFNLVQTTGAVNLNQTADCFSISLARGLELPAVAIAQPQPVFEIDIAQGPMWAVDQLSQAGQPQAIPIVLINFVLAIILFSATRFAKRAVVALRTALAPRQALALAQLQVFRC